MNYYLFVLTVMIATAEAQSNTSLVAKMDDMTVEADELARDFSDSQYKYTSKIRTKLVALLLRLIPAETEVKREDDPELQEKFDDIVLLLEKKMRVKYDKIKERISALLSRFLAPALAPFTIMNAPSQDQLQRALLTPDRTTPYNRDVDYRPINSDPVGAGFDLGRPYLPTSSSTRFTNYQPNYLPSAQLPYRQLQPQISYLNYNRYPSDYGAIRSEQYYWPSYQQRLPYRMYQEVQPSSQWYWSSAQPQLQPQRQQYYWAYPYGRVYGQK